MNILTPTDEEEHPLPQFIGRIRHHDGRVKVTSFDEHPEEVCDHKVVVDGRN